MLAEKGKNDLLEEVRSVSEMMPVSYVRQKPALGLGHAVLQARDLVGNEPFAVLLGDDIVDAAEPCIGQMMRLYERRGNPVIALQEVPRARDAPLRHRGREPAPRTASSRSRTWSRNRSPTRRPSNLAIIGRYLLPPEIFGILEETRSDVGGEIQLTSGAEDAALARPDRRIPFRGQALRRRRQARVPEGDGRVRSEAAGPGRTVPRVPEGLEALSRFAGLLISFSRFSVSALLGRPCFGSDLASAFAARFSTSSAFLAGFDSADLRLRLRLRSASPLAASFPAGVVGDVEAAALELDRGRGECFFTFPPQCGQTSRWPLAHALHDLGLALALLADVFVERHRRARVPIVPHLQASPLGLVAGSSSRRRHAPRACAAGRDSRTRRAAARSLPPSPGPSRRGAGAAFLRRPFRRAALSGREEVEQVARQLLLEHRLGVPEPLDQPAHVGARRMPSRIASGIGRSSRTTSAGPPFADLEDDLARVPVEAPQRISRTWPATAGFKPLGRQDPHLQQNVAEAQPVAGLPRLRLARRAPASGCRCAAGTCRGSTSLSFEVAKTTSPRRARSAARGPRARR